MILDASNRVLPFPVRQLQYVTYFPALTRRAWGKPLTRARPRVVGKGKERAEAGGHDGWTSRRNVGRSPISGDGDRCGLHIVANPTHPPRRVVDDQNLLA